MKYTVVIKTLFGLEEVLKKELEEIGITEVTVLSRAIEFEADLEQIYKCNLHLRTALSVLVKISYGKVRNENELYSFIRKVEWDSYFDIDKTIAVRAVSLSTKMNHSLFLEQKTKDAIVDYFRDKYGYRPDVDVRNPQVNISLYLTDDICILYLDSSGKPLYLRGFDKEIGEAPINECLAAGILYLSGWNCEDDLIDTMCGSGTFITEAYMMASKFPPTIKRREFAFLNWKNFDYAIWQNILTNAHDQIIKTNANIIACDISPDAVRLTRSNLMKIDREHTVKTLPKNFFHLKGFTNGGLIVCNPPYGERLKLADSKAFYKKIGDKLKFDFAGYTAWIISSDLAAVKFIGMKPEKKIELYNGRLECRLLSYSIYKGSRKDRDYK
ncbi:MAG: RNA methyltransferase [Marinilabiliales bacterium]|nr:MAG: RNA methyltransferase [Marinilabiliales bacterium]